MQRSRPASPSTGARSARGGIDPADRRRLNRLFSYLKPYRGRLAFGIVAVALASLVGLAFPLLVRELLNDAFSPGTTPAQGRMALDRVALVLAGLVLLQAVFNFLRSYHLGRVGEAVVADLRTELFSHLLTLPVRFFEERKTGEITSRLTSDVATVQSAVSQALAQLVNQGITLVGGLIVLFVLDVRLTLVMLLVVPAVAFAAVFFGRGLRKVSTRFQDLVAEANSYAEEAISGIRVVKSFTAEPLERRRYGAAIDASFRQALRRVMLRALFIPSVILFGFTGVGVVLWYGGRLVVNGTLQGGDLVAFMLITLFVAGSVGTFTTLWAQLQEAIGASRRIFELLDERSDLPDPERPVTLEKVEGRVTFDDVTFGYDPGRPVLRSISLEARPGKVVALVGPSGAGKSSLVGLVSRFFDPQEGRVLLDGVDLRRLPVRQLRSVIGVVPQETQLFSGSILDNIRYGREDAPASEVRAAAKAANADEFIEQLDNGYDTLVGERGVKLSGGQRQRVAIARALLKDPRILILDEATSSLDSESEALVQAALTVLMKGRTTFVIAHRLATILGADEILVVDRGRIVERGPHAALLKAGGLYADLFQRQFAPESVGAGSGR